MPRLPRRPRRGRLTGPLLVAAAVALVLPLAACGDDEPPTAAEEARSRAESGLLGSYSATYAIKDAKGADGGQLSIWRSPTTLRLDVRTAAGTSTSITTPQRTVACQVPATAGRKPTCLEVAGAGKTPPAAFDPELRKVFGDALRVLADEANGLTVTEKPAVTPTGAAGAAARCFEVKTTATTEGKIANGTYCLTEDGVPATVTFGSGSLTLTQLDPAEPNASVFVPTTSPTPLPTTAR